MAKDRRLIAQADLTNDPDLAFLEWIKGLRRRRKLSEQVREGLRHQFLMVQHATKPVRLEQQEPLTMPQLEVRVERQRAGDPAKRLGNLLKGF